MARRIAERPHAQPRDYALSVEVAPAALAWLCRALSEHGLATFEEQKCESGVRLIAYSSGDGAEERLARIGRRLAERHRQARVEGAIAYAVSEIGRDWQTAWTAHLDNVALTARLCAVPHRPDGERLPGELYLEPAFAFGYGEHPSTRLAARWLESECRGRGGMRLLDVGCGTGILSLVALASGAAHATGVDTSAEAVQVARRNAAINGWSKRVRFVEGSVADARGTFDCVVANVEALVLAELSSDIVSALAAGGSLALAGFVAEQVPTLRRRYGDLGFALSAAGQEGDWCALSGRRANPRP